MPVRAVATLAVATLAAACHGPAANGRTEPAGTVVPAVTATVTPAIRTDLKPIVDRLSALGELRQVRWMGGAKGENSGRIPGPTDVWIKALVLPEDEGFREILSDYRWEAATDPKIDESLAGELDVSGAWFGSEGYTARLFAEGGASYVGRVFMNEKRRLLYVEFDIS